MKVKELLDLLQCANPSHNLYVNLPTCLSRVIMSIRLDISSVTLVRSGPISYHFKVKDIIKRLKSQGHKDLYFEIDLGCVKYEKTKLKPENVQILREPYL